MACPTSHVPRMAELLREVEGLGSWSCGVVHWIGGAPVLCLDSISKDFLMHMVYSMLFSDEMMVLRRCDGQL